MVALFIVIRLYDYHTLYRFLFYNNVNYFFSSSTLQRNNAEWNDVIQGPAVFKCVKEINKGDVDIVLICNKMLVSIAVGTDRNNSCSGRRYTKTTLWVR